MSDLNEVVSSRGNREGRVFTFMNNMKVRTDTTRDGSVWFVAKDLADALGYSQTQRALELCKNSNSLLNSEFNKINNLPVATKWVPESDMYRLIMRSNKEEAEAFQDWVVEEVLPSIRKTGRYVLADRAEDLAIVEGRIKRLEEQYGKPAHEIRPTMCGEAYFTDIQWHHIMGEMHAISQLSERPREALTSLDDHFRAYRKKRVVGFDHAMEYFGRWRRVYEDGYLPSGRVGVGCWGETVLEEDFI